MTTAKPKLQALSTGDRVSGETVDTLSKRMEMADLERQQNRSDLGTHEKICAERYNALNQTSADIKATLLHLQTDVKAISDAQVANAAVAAAAIANARPKWWMQFFGAAVIALIGWMASTIWSMETAKVDALQSRPAAAVTVNPAPALMTLPPTVPAPPATDVPPT